MISRRKVASAPIAEHGRRTVLVDLFDGTRIFDLGGSTALHFSGSTIKKSSLATMMLCRAARLSSSSSSRRRDLLCRSFLRAKSTQVEGASPADKGPIGKDGRHEIWREDIYDHDNEPR